MNEEEREKNKAACKDWYRRNKKRKYEMHLRYRQDIARYLDDLKRSAGCSRCTERDAICLLFHHSDPGTKLFDLALAYGGRHGIERINAEIAKCEILCANCHRKHHWAERDAMKTRP